MELVVDPRFAAGLMLATIRAAAFVIATPVLPLPPMGRLAMAVALGWFLAVPIGDDLGMFSLAVAAVVNISIGWALGFLTGVLFSAFPIAGGLLDVMSGMGVSALYDPIQGATASLFNRLFAITAATFFLVIGGHRMLVEGLAISVQRIPLDGALVLDASLGAFALDLTRTMLVAAIELALPAMAALFVAEVVIALSSRFAPQANLFVLGLPLRILIALFGASTVLMLFPETSQGLLRLMRDAMVAGIRGFGG